MEDIIERVIKEEIEDIRENYENTKSVGKLELKEYHIIIGKIILLQELIKKIKNEGIEMEIMEKEINDFMTRITEEN